MPDFSPLSQDKLAIQLIRERGAIDDIRAGRIERAVSRCRNIWASLPGAGYGQREHSLESWLPSGARLAGWWHESPDNAVCAGRARADVVAP